MSLPKPKIIVVDDNSANLAAMRVLLGKLPCEVVTAQSGNEGLAACVRGDFALMFLDIEMPAMDGYEVAELLKGDPSTRHIPIVFLSANRSDQASRMRAYSVGAVDYIEKPLEELVVLAKASMFLDLHASKQKLRQELARSETMRYAARENEARYREALDGAPIPIMVLAEDGEVMLVNRTWQELTGYSAGEISTLEAWTQRAYGSQAEEVRSHVRQLFGITGTMHEGDYVVRTAHGTNLIWTFRSAPLAALPDGRRVIVGMAEDITGYRRAMRAQEDSRLVAQHADRAKGEFLANMSHEIRTPMNAIIGLSQLALETELSPRQQDYLLKIKSSSSALLGIINDILDYSKIEAGRLEIETVPFFLEETLRDVANLFLPGLEQKGLELFVELAPGTPLSLVGDPLRLGQVLNNLVGNAVKFTERGEIHLRVEAMETDEQQVLLRFSVRDTGIGLSKEQVDGLFRPFVQADTSITRRYGGTGLGLTICRHLVELMDGHIAVSSAPGEGSIFAFTARLGIGVERRDLGTRHHLHGLRTLVVDDQETSRQILQDMIESWSGQVVTLSDGERVIDEIERAEAEGNPFELILLDWHMPGRNGVEVARHIEQEALAGRVKRPPMVIMVTAYSKDRLLEDSGAVHLDGFLTKPVTPSALFNAVMGVRTPGLAHPVDVRGPSGTPYDMALPIHGARVLVVEDNAINQEVAREFLEKAGLHVTIANDGREGVALAGRTRFDVVLMDLQMPEMDGFEASRLIRSLPGGDALPIIAMTAAAMPRDKQACAEAGMNDHVSKPIVPGELLATLVRWVKPREVPAAVAPCPPSPGEDFPDIPGIDGRQASMRLGGNRTLFISLLGQVADRCEAMASDIQAEIAANRPMDAARLLHTLRGVAGNVSANVVAELASKTEAAIRDGRTDGLPDLLDRLDDGLRSLVSSIRAHLASIGPADNDGVSAPLEGGALDTLLRALRARDAEALDQFEALHPAIKAAHGLEFAARLRSAIDGLRFDDAADLLSKIEVAP